MTLRDWLIRSRLEIAQASHTLRATLSGRTSAAAPELARLEDRIMMSASPVAVVVEAPEEVSESAQVNDGEDIRLPDDALALIDTVEDLAAADNVDAEQARELIFVDASVEGYETLVEGLQEREGSDNYEVIILDQNRNGIAQITEALLSFQDVDAMHIVSHGSDGAMQLGNVVLTNENFGNYQKVFAGWANSLTGDADILLYGCNLAATQNGQELMQRLGAACDCDVAASDDLTGHTDLGGDWELEYEVGSVESATPFSQSIQATWFGTLASYTVTNTLDDGSVGSLRWAIAQANANAGTDTITFSISDALVGGAHTIDIQSALPDIIDTVIIDGTTDSDYSVGNPIIVLNGASAGAGIDGLKLASGSDGSTIRGLVVNRFDDDGIDINSDNNTIAGNIIGLDVTGMISSGFGNDNQGIDVDGDYNIIGGSSSSDRNVISGNLDGLEVTGSFNTIIGNYIGTDVDGNTALGNTSFGVELLAGAQNNIVGTNGDSTNDADEGNVIAGNLSSGVYITDIGTVDNRVAGNFIGLAADGFTARANTIGVRVTNGASANIIGGDIAAERNYTSGNNVGGVMFDGGANDNIISGNTVGLAADGSTIRGNDGFGVFANTKTTIGGDTAAERNVISGNNADGIYVGSGATDVTIIGNYIGLNEAGDAARGNGDYGVRVVGASDTIIGSGVANEGNVISGNANGGILVEGGGNSGTIIRGNIIGLNATANAAVGNQGDGINIFSPSVGTLIGGNSANDRNIISGNNGNGIGEYGGSGTIVTGNYVGTDGTGLVALGNLQSGIAAVSASGFVVGGSGTGEGNVLSGNTNSAVYLQNVDGAQILGNFIGVGSDGTTAVGNNDGVHLESQSTNTIIGGIAAGAGNVIAFSSTYGVFVKDSTSTGNTIRGNSIRNNGGAGVDLEGDGANPNDASDVDAGGNTKLNWPILKSVSIADDGTLSYELDTTTMDVVSTVDFYASTDRDGGQVEGARYLGTGGFIPTGNSSYTNSVGGVTLTPGEYVTVLVTDGSGNTSEFSNYAVATDSDAGGATPSDLYATTSSEGGLSINHDGGNDVYLQADDGGAIVGGLDQVTLEASLAFDSTPTGSVALISYAEGSNDEALGLFVSSSGQLLFTANSSGAAQVSAGTYSQLFDGNRHHIAVSWNGDVSGNGEVEFYVDGVVVESFAGYQTNQSIGGGGTLVIGNDQDTVGGGFDATQAFKGTLYDIRIFSEIRTDGEIAASYRVDVPHDEPDMIANWQFNELSSDGVVTETVSGNNLTVKHVAQSGFTASTPELTFALDENSLAGTVVGSVTGVDAEREAQIASLLAADSDLRYSAETGKFYKVVVGTFDQTVAKSAAEGTALNTVNGQLVTIRSAYENQFVTSISSGTPNVWLGGTDATFEGEWRWIESGQESDKFWDGVETGYNNGAYSNWFSATQPNDAGGNEDAVRLETASGEWYDAPTTGSAVSYVIEWKVDTVLDATEALTYAIQTQTVAGAFEADASTGEITVADGSLLDYETNATHSITIRTTDVDSNTYDEVFTVSLNDLTEQNTAPSDLSSGIELNTDGGNDSYLFLTDGRPVLGGLNQLTVEASFQIDSVPASYIPIIDYTESGISTEFGVAINVDGSIRIVVDDGAVQSTSGTYSQLLDGQQHHIAVSWDSTNGDVHFYVDGEYAESFSGFEAGHSLYSGTATQLTIGNDPDDAGDYYPDKVFSGTIYDVRVWNEARSEAEIGLNFQNKFDSGSLPVGLVANWQMDGFNGSDEIVDVVSANNLSVGHASGAGFTASTPVDDLHISENAVGGTSVGFVVPSDPDSPQDVVSDGLFTEAGTPATWTQYTSGSTLGDWAVIGGSVYLQNGDGSYQDPTPLGGNAVHIPPELDAGITQTLTTEIGRQYQVVFAASGSWNSADLRQMRVSAGGISQDVIFDEAPANYDLFTNIVWEHRSLTFTASDTSTDLTFQDTTSTTTHQGIMLADVQVIEIPQAVTTILNNDSSLSYDAATGKFYRFVNSPDNFNDALAAATGASLNGIDGQLVTIRSQYENDLVRQHVLDSGNQIWIGTYDTNNDGNWNWLDGNAESSEQFWTGGNTGSATNNFFAPDFYQSEGAGEDYARMLAGGEWSDNSESSNYAYIIEWDASEVLSTFTFSLTDSSGNFDIDVNTGEITVAVGNTLDYETSTSHDVDVTVTDAAGNSFTELSMTIEVDDVDDVLVAVTDTIATDEDTPVTFNPISNDSSDIGDTNTIVEVTQPANGTVVDNGDGTLTYTPNSNYNGADSFEYVAIDSGTGLQHYWGLDGNANDAVGSADGTITGTTTVAGDFGNGLEFNESASDYVTLPDVTYNNDFTISFEFKVDEINGSLFQYLYSHGDINGANSINVFISEDAHGTDPNVLRTVVRDVNDTLDNTALEFDISGSGLNLVDSQFHTYTLTSGPDGLEVFIDGVSVASDATRGTDGVNPTGDLYLGRRSTTPADRYFGGVLDSVQIYDNALGSQQVADLASGTNRATVNVTIDTFNDAPTFHVAGPGGFGSGSLVGSPGTAATSVVTADLDGDGDEDVVSSDQTGNTISWFEKDGNGSFITHSLATSAIGPTSVAISDVDGDGDLDVLSASTTDDKIAWYENDGAGSFTAHTITTLANGATDVTTADLDGDGDMDVLSSSSVDDTIAWYENDGSENFTLHTITTLANAARMVSVADVNQDGHLDVLTASYADSTISWFENDGSQNFTERIVTSSATGARYVQAADLDDDGDIDLVGSSEGNDEVFWFENDGTESFSKNLISTAYSDVWEFVVADFDGDSDSDIALADFGNTGDVVWLENNGSEVFSENVIATGTGNPISIALGDIDGDSDKDLLTAAWSDGDITWYEGLALQTTLDGNPTFTEGGAAVVLDADVEIFDAELGAADDFGGATITFARVGGANSDDNFNRDLASNLTFSGANFLLSGVQKGSYLLFGGQLSLTFDAGVTNAEVNEVMQSIAYRNLSDTPPASVYIEWTFNDGNSGAQGSGGALTASGSTIVDIIDTAEPASITVPIAQSVDEDSPLTFSTGGGNAIAIDGGSSYDPIVSTTLSVTNGTLTLSGTAGITFLDGTSDGDATLTISGTESDINAALDGLQFQGNQDFNGSDTLMVTTGSSADAEADLYARYEFLGGATTDESGNGYDGTVSGDPTLTSDAERGDVMTLDGDDFIAVTNGISGITDDVTISAWVNLDAGQTDNVFLSLGDEVYVILDPTNTSQGIGGRVDSFTSYSLNNSHRVAGTGWHHVALTLDNTNHVLNVYLDGQLTRSSSNAFVEAEWGTAASQDIVIGGRTDGSQGFVGSIDDVRVYDSELSESEIIAIMGDQGFDSESVAITLDAVNDAPTIGAPPLAPPATEGVSESMLSVFTVNDVDSSTSDVTATLTVGEGILTATIGDSGVAITGSGTATLTVTGSVADVNAWLNAGTTGTLDYLNDLDAPSSSTLFSITVNDGGNTGSDPGLSGDGSSEETTRSSTILITPVNDAATISTGFDEFIGDFGGSTSTTVIGKATVSSDNWIAIDGDQTYDVSVTAFSGDGGGGNYDAGETHYLGFFSYDIDGNQINSRHTGQYAGAVDTTLAVDLVAGATQIVLNDATGWYEGSADVNRSLAWYGYTNSLGETYDDYTYTRNFISDLWDENGIDHATNTITLRTAWTGPTILAGDAVRNMSPTGGTYQYPLLSNGAITETPTEFTATIGGGFDSGATSQTLFRHGTAYIEAMSLANFTGTSNQLNLSDFTIDTAQGTTLFTEDGGPIAISDADFAITDPDDTHAESVTITLTDGRIGDILNVNETGINALGISVSGIPAGNLSADGSITLTLTSDTPNSVTFQDYKDAIDLITFDNNSDDPDTTDRTLTFVVSDGDADSETEELVIKVHAVDDAPVVATTALDPTFTEDGAAVHVFSGTTIDAVEAGDQIGSFEISVTGLTDGQNEQLVINSEVIDLTNGNAGTTDNAGFDYSVSVSGSTATVTVSRDTPFAAATAAVVVDNVRYQNSSESPSGADRTVTLESITEFEQDGVNDTTIVGTASVVTIAGVNDAPEFIGPELISNGTFDSDISGWSTTGTVLFHASGAMSLGASNTVGPHTASQTIATENGETYRLTFDYRDTSPIYNQSLQVTVDGSSNLLTTSQIVTDVDGDSYVRYEYTFTADSSTSTITFTDTSDTAGVSDDTTNVDGHLDNVSVKQSNGDLGAISITEGDGPTAIYANVDLFDAELSGADDFGGLTININRVGGNNTNDEFSASGLLGALTEGGNLVYNSVVVGSVNTNSGGSLNITFDPGVDNATANAVIQTIAYENTSDDPATNYRLNINANDGNFGNDQGTGGDLSSSAYITVDMTPVNDAAVVGINAGVTVAEGGSTVITNAMLDEADPDDSGAGVIYRVRGDFNQGALIVNGVALETEDTFTQADVDAGLVVLHSSGAQDGVETLRLAINDGGEDGTGETNINVVVTFTATNDAPVAADDPAGTVANLATDPDTVGFWRLGESAGTTAVDESGNNNGTYNNVTLGVTGVTGSNTAADFNGSDSHVDLGNLDVAGTGLTMAAWINVDNFGGGDGRIFGKSDGVFSDDHTFMLSTYDQGANNYLRFRISAGGYTETLIANAATSMATGQWYHVAATYDVATGDMAIYLNGEQVDFANHSVGGAVDQDPTRNVWIGGNPVGGNYLDGRIDEALLMERSMSASEIAALAELSAPDYSLTEGVTLSVNSTNGLLQNDSDADGDSLTVTEVNGVGANVGSQISIGLGGLLTVNSDGSFDFDTNGLYEHVSAGSTYNETFSYTVDDGNGGTDTATATITINGENDAPVADLNGSDGGGIDYSDAFTEGDSAVSIVDSDATISDIDSTHYEGLGVNLSGFGDGTDERIFINGVQFQFGVSTVPTTTVGSTLFDLDFDGTGFTITRSAGGSIPQADLQALLRTMTYENVSQDPTAGDRLFSIVPQDDQSANASPVAVSTITVSAVNDVPTIVNLDGDTLAYDEGDGAVVIEQGGNAVVSDVDSSNFDGGTLTVTISAGGENAEDVLSIRNQGTNPGEVGVSGSNVTFGGTTVGTFTGGLSGTPLTITWNASSTPLAVTQVVQNVTYENTDTLTPTGGARTIDFVVTDGDGGTSLTHQATVNVSSTNNAPTITDLGGDTLSYSEGDGQQAIEQSGDALVADVDSSDFDTGTLTVSFTAGSDSAEDVLSIINTGIGLGETGISGSNVTYEGTTIGTFTGGSGGSDLVITLNANADAEAASALAQQIAYENTDTDNPTTGNRTVQIQLTDGDGGTSTPYLTTVDFTAVNDTPTIADLAGDTLNYSEGDGAVVIEQGADAAASDVDSADFDGGNLNVFFFSGDDPVEDTLSIRSVGTGVGEVGVSGSNVTYEGTIIGMFTGGGGGTNLVVSFNANANHAAVSALLQSITYENTDTDNPTTGTRNVHFRVADGDGATSISHVAQVNVTGVNDDPVVDDGGTYTINEGDSLNLDASGTTDVDGGTLTYRWDLDNDGQYDDLVTTNASETVTWATLSGFGVDDDGTYTIGLQVDDGNGGVVNSSTTLTVDNTAPVLTATGNVTVAGGATYTLNLLDVDSGDDTITSWTVNWGDGTVTIHAGDPTSVTHTYSNDLAGLTLDITVSAVDEDGTHFGADLLVPTYAGTDAVHLYDGTSGDFLGLIAPFGDGIDDHVNIVTGPNGNYFVSGLASDNILEYQPDGTLVGEFVVANDGGLTGPAGIAFGPDGNLYVASYGTNEVLRFDGTTGAFIDVFVATSSGLTDPLGLTFGPDGDLYVANRSSEGVIKFDGLTGAVDGSFNAPTISFTEDIAFGPDGNIYVASLSNGVLQLNGSTGALLGTFVADGSGGLNEAAGLAFGPDGNLYVADQAGDAVRRYNGTTGAYIDDYVPAGGGGLDSPAYLAFAADHQVTVVDNNAPPVVATGGGDLSYTENAAAVSDNTITLSDVDSASMSGATVQITGNYQSGEDELVYLQVGSIVGVWHSGSGTMTLSGSGTVAEYEAALRAVGYQNTNEDPNNTTRQLSYVVNDGVEDSNLLVKNVLVYDQNDAPTLGNGTLADVAEDTTSPPGDEISDIFAGQFADVDGGDTFAGIVIVSDATATEGSWQYSTDTGSNWFDVGSVSSSAGLVLDETAMLRFVPAANYNGAIPTLAVHGLDSTFSGTFSSGATQEYDDVTTRGGTTPISDSSATISSSVTSVNDGPVITSGPGGGTHNEGAPGTFFNNSLTISDIDSADFDGGVMTVTITGNGEATDRLTILDGGDVSLVGTSVRYDFGGGPVEVGTLSGGNGVANPLTITFDADADETAVQAVGQRIVFRAESDDPSDLQRTLTMSVTDGNGGTSNTATRGMNVVAFNDNPFNAGGNLSATPINVTEDVQTGLELSFLHIFDWDDRGLGMTVTVSTSGAGNLYSSSNGGVAVAGSGSDTLTLTGATADIDTFFNVSGSIGYLHATPNTSGNAADTLTIVLNDNGNYGVGGGGDINIGTATINIAAVNDSAVLDLDADNDSGAADPNYVTSFTEDGGPVLVADSDAVLSDVDDTDLESLTITLSAIPDGIAEVLAADTTGTSITANYSSGTGVLSLSGVDTVANYLQVLKTVTYNNTSQDPDTNARSMTIVANDGDTNSNTAVTVIQMTEVNDAPINSVPPTQNIDEDATLIFSIGNGNSISVSDIDDGGGNLRVQLNVGVGGLLTLSQTSGLTFSAGDGTGDANMIFTGTAANINAALEGLNFDATPDFNGSVNLTVTTNDLGNTGTDPGTSGDATSEEDSDVIIINVSAVNDSPVVAGPGSPYVVDEQAALSIEGSGFSVADVDAATGTMSATIDVGEGVVTVAEGNSGVIITGGNGSGTVTITGTLSQIDHLFTGAGTGTITYTNGSDDPSASTTITVTVNDGGNVGSDPGLTADGSSEEDSASQTINITAVNDAPVATVSNGVVSFDEGDGPVGLFSSPSVDTVEAGQSIREIVIRVSSLANGSDEVLVVDGQSIELTDLNGETTAANGYAVAVTVNGSNEATVTITRAGNFSTADAEKLLDDLAYQNTSDDIADGSRLITFFSISDDGGNANGGNDTGSPAIATLVNVNSVNDAPVMPNDTTVNVDENTTSVGTFSATDPDSGDTLTYSLIGVDAAIFNINSSTGEVTFVVAPDFETPNDNGGDNTYDITVVATDDGVGNLSDSQNVAVSVTDVNEAPSDISPNSFSVDENTDSSSGYSVGVLTSTDQDFGDTSTYSILGGVDAASFSIGGLNSDELILTDGVLDFETQASYSVVVRVTDSGGLTYNETIVVSVNDLGEAPVVTVPVAQTVAEDTPLSISGISVTDPDADLTTVQISVGNGTLTVSLQGATTISAGANGTSTLTVAGSEADINNTLSTLSYLASLNFNGSDTIAISATDSLGLIGANSIAVTVSPVNDAPVGGADQFSTFQAETLSVGTPGVAANDSDVDGDALTFVLLSGTSNGTLTFNSDGSFVYTPNAAFIGVDTFTYAVDDGVLTSTSVTVSITTDVPPVGPPGGGGDSDADNDDDNSTDDDQSSGDDNEDADESAVVTTVNVSPIAVNDTIGGIVSQVLSSTANSLGSQADASADSQSVISDEFEAKLNEEKQQARRLLSRAVRVVDIALQHTVDHVGTIRTLTSVPLIIGHFGMEDDASPVPKIEFETLVVGSTAIASSTLSVGYVVWLLRGGSLFASLLSSIPAWQSFDPLPILQSYAANAPGKDDDSDGLVELVNKSNDSVNA